MRLINTKTLEIEEFFGSSIPLRYAILSHTWEMDEVTFQDWKDLQTASSKKGFRKILGAINKASKHGFKYLWVDTNCIDKSSSAELSEAINSMFDWYGNATICYAYLGDIIDPKSHYLSPNMLGALRKSKWFTRGWTLQELLAPKNLVFYSQDWTKIASRSLLADMIYSSTQIEPQFLTREWPLSKASVAKKMSWLSRRNTKRVEDMAYCMLGLFDINMPLLYGEGSRAFTRLQEEIIKVSDDHTIFTWTWTNAVPRDWVSMLAPCPETFKHSGCFIRTRSGLGSTKAYSMSNVGLSITLSVTQTWSYYLAILNAKHEKSHTGMRACIPIRGYLDNEQEDKSVMERIAFPPGPIFLYSDWTLCRQPLFIRCRPQNNTSLSLITSGQIERPQYSFLLIFDTVNKLLDSGLGGRTFQGVSLTEKTKDLIGFETYPAGMFDASKSIIRMNMSRNIDGVLLKLGHKENGGCVLYLGLKISSKTSQPLRFCIQLPAKSWGKEGANYKEHRRKLRRSIDKLLDEHETGQTVFTSSDHNIIISDEVKLENGVTIYPTFITPNRARISWMSTFGTMNEDEDDIEASSIVPGLSTMDGLRANENILWTYEVLNSLRNR